MRPWLLALPLLVGCTADPADDSTATDESMATPAAGYFELRADLRKCPSPMCGGYFVSRLNRLATPCLDGSYRDACYVPALDMGRLSGFAQDRLAQFAYRDATTPGVFAIVRGNLEAARSATPLPEVDHFVVSEAWVAVGETPSEGVFVRIADNGIRCFAAPCPSLGERTLNWYRETNIADVDFTPAKLGERDVERLMAAELTDGIIVAGYRYTVDVGGRTAAGRTATAAYLELH